MLTVNRRNNFKAFDFVAEKEKLWLYYLELKKQKDEQRAEERRIARANSSNGTRYLDLYEKGKHDVVTRREHELAAQTETPLTVTEADHFPSHKGNLLYEISREEIAKYGKEKRRKIENERTLSNLKPPPAPIAPSRSLNQKTMKYEVASPEEIADRLHNMNTISLDMRWASRSKSSHQEVFQSSSYTKLCN